MQSSITRKGRTMKINYQSYKQAINRAFSVNMTSPAIKWDGVRGFFVESSLVPNDKSEVTIGRANYYLPDCTPSFTGTRSEYASIARSLRALIASEGLGNFNGEDLRGEIMKRETIDIY